MAEKEKNRKKINAEYLRDLQGEIPIVTDFQLKFLKDVVSIMEEKIVNGVDLQQDEEKKLQVIKELSTITEKLTVIISRLKDGPNAKTKFLENYPKFEAVSKATIEQCKEIAKSMQNDKFNCNVSKTVGYMTSLVGGGLCAASTFAIPFTFGLSSPLAVGGSMLAAGSVTAFGTSIVQSVRLKIQINRAHSLFLKYMESFQEISCWLNHASDLENALAGILEIDIVKDTCENAKRIVTKGMEIIKHSDRLIYLEENLKSIMKHPPKNWKVLEYASVVLALVTLFVLTVKTKNRLVFDVAAFTIKWFVGIVQLAGDEIDAEKLLNLFKIKAVISKAVLHRVVAGLGAVMDVISIAKTMKDIHKGSSSPEAENILKAVLEMEKVASKFTNVYENIKLL